jgi:very-short-patch-repair endonuclease
MPSTRARELRSNPTDAEKHLWSKLRLRQIDGHRFRRQVPIGRDIVDFVCFDRRLIIEVDGGQHDSRIAQDDARTAWLEREGFTVLRFWNNEVLGNIEGVYDAIVAHLASDIPPS